MTVSLDRVHPVAALFPLLDEKCEAFQELVASIGDNGLIDPIVVDDDDVILDGRNRLRACQIANIEPRFVRFRDVNFKGSSDLFAFVRNFGRRDLTPDQRVAIRTGYQTWRLRAANVERKVDAGKATGRGNRKEKVPTNSSEPLSSASHQADTHTRVALAEAAGVSEYKAQQALNVQRDAPEMLPAIAAGEVTLREAEKQAKAKKAKKPSKPRPFNVDRAVDEVVKAFKKRLDACPSKQRKALHVRTLEAIDALERMCA